MFPFFTMVLFLQIRTCSCKFCFHHSLPTGLRKKFYNHISNNQSHDLDLQNSKKQNRERERRTNALEQLQDIYTATLPRKSKSTGIDCLQI